MYTFLAEVRASQPARNTPEITAPRVVADSADSSTTISLAQLLDFHSVGLLGMMLRYVFRRLVLGTLAVC